MVKKQDELRKRFSLHPGPLAKCVAQSRYHDRLSQSYGLGFVCGAASPATAKPSAEANLVYSSRPIRNFFADQVEAFAHKLHALRFSASIHPEM